MSMSAPLLLVSDSPGSRTIRQERCTYPPFVGSAEKRFDAWNTVALLGWWTSAAVSGTIAFGLNAQMSRITTVEPAGASIEPAAPLCRESRLWE